MSLTIQRTMSDKAIATEMGERFKQLRLRHNVTLETLHQRTLISLNTLKALERGKGKLETMITVLRELQALEDLDKFIAPIEISPIQLADNQGKKRLRARTAKSTEPAIIRTESW